MVWVIKMPVQILSESTSQIFSGYQHPAKDKLIDFACFSEGWNLGEGESFSSQIIKRTYGLVEECLEKVLFDIDVFPGLDGDIRLTVYEQNDYYEFNIAEDITYYHEKSGIQQEEGQITGEDAVTIIREIGRRKWSSFEYSTSHGLIGDSEGSKALHSNHANTPYRYLSVSAL